MSVQTVHSKPVSTISSYMYIFSANCSYSYESNNYYGSNEVLQLLVFSVKCDNSNCIGKLQTFQRKIKIWFELLTTSSDLHSLSNFIPQLAPCLSKLDLSQWLNENISSHAYRQQKVACKVDCPRQLKPQVKSVLAKF